MPLHNLKSVSCLPLDRKKQLLTDRSGAMIHEAGHVIALRRYGLVPYYIYIGIVGSRGAAQRPSFFGKTKKDDEFISAAGALMERKLFGAYDQIGCTSDMVSIASGRQFALDKLNIEKFTISVLDDFADFPTDDEAELAIKLHDKIEILWDSAQNIRGYKKFTYYSLRDVIKAKSFLRDLDVSFVSYYGFRKSFI
ncbi:hypothetical protein [Methylobacterium planeticum]|uniref:Uncharacterized protein n=1 Tax=Methylobacterium planeticum TaxID=2615211 RepID=A0A6N6MKA7_9HYPH|nr:hypothetical protein [Methylobacterium planeticum]KAB1070578.1 hypothetical protein F6X51_22190 [Methylobacterium planeticum]